MEKTDPAPSTLGEGNADGSDRLEFLAAHGGPFFELQRRLNLLHEKSLCTGRRILLFVTIAWVVPLLLTLPTLGSDSPTFWAYLSDPGPWSRFLVGIAAFVAAEQAVETGLRRKLGQFLRAPMIPPESQDQAGVAYARRCADGTRHSRNSAASCSPPSRQRLPLPPSTSFRLPVGLPR